MGKALVEVVDFVRVRCRGGAAVELARLNLLVGRALSRSAAEIADEPELVERAWSSARSIVRDDREIGRTYGGAG